MVTMVGRRLMLIALYASAGGATPLLSAQQTIATVPSDNIRSTEALLHRPVTLSLSHVSLARALDTLSRLTNIPIQYRASLLERCTSPVSIRAKHLSFGVVVEQLLSGTGLRVAPNGQGALTILANGPSLDSLPLATGGVSGRIMDSVSDHGVAGATVSIQGTPITAKTTDRGEFVLRQVPAGDRVLIVRGFGFRPTSRAVTVLRDGTITVTLRVPPAPNVISGVVTTATGVQRKLEVGNDITTLNVDSIMQIAPITSVTDLLETRVPGLVVQRTSGAPGSPSRLRLRGAGSINGNNDPIVIVDGVRVYAAQSDARNANQAAIGIEGKAVYATPSPLDQIDPNTIETIEVFKGPSASAVYGSDAANGVIVITTRRGKVGPPRWDVTLDQGISYFPGSYREGLYTFGHILSGGIEELVPAFGRPGTPYKIDSTRRFQALNDDRYTPLGHGLTQRQSVSVSGGSNTVHYDFTGSGQQDRGYTKLPSMVATVYRAQYGVEPPSWMKHPERYSTWSGQGTIGVTVSSELDVLFSSQLFHSNQQQSPLTTNALAFSRVYIDSAFLADPNQVTSFGRFDERVTSEMLHSTHTAQANWRRLSWLPINATAGLDLQTRDDETMIPRALNVSADADAGQYGVGRGTALARTLSATTLLPVIPSKLMASVGVNWYDQTTKDVSGQGKLAPGQTVPGTLLAATPASSELTTFGWFVEPRFNVASRFFVMPAFRLDNNGLAGRNARLLGLPKLNFSWLASEEPFFPWKQTITLLRLRSGFGTAGTQPDPTQRLRLYQTDNDSAGLSTLGNTQLRPERSTELEGGADAELWNGRFSLNTSAYRKVRHDAIVDTRVGVSLGTTSLFSENIGVVRNTGVELTVGVRPIETALLTWNANVNYSRNANVVTRLNAGILPVQGSGIDGEFTRIVEGYPLFGLWARPIIGYADADRNGQINPTEVVLGDSSVYLGQSEPKYQMNINNQVGLWHGRVSVTATVSYQSGMTLYDKGAVADAADPFIQAEASSGEFGREAAVAALYAANGGSPYGVARAVNVLRFQSLSINVTAPPRVARIIRARSAMLALQGSNLGLRTNYAGHDPNVNSSVTGNFTLDSGALPQPRTWALHVNLGY